MGDANQPDSQESNLSDRDDELVNINEKFQSLIRENSLAEVEVALSNGAININYQNVHGDTSLHVAVRNKAPAIVKLLIDRGADFDIPNRNGKTPFQMVEKRLMKDHNDDKLQSIEAILKRAQAGPSTRTRKYEDPDSQVTNYTQSTESQSKKPKFEYYPASGLRLNFHGPIYQIKLLALFVNRALRYGYEFSLASEMDYAESLDDIVFTYNNLDQQIWRFVQAKHKQSIDKKITISELISNDSGRDFSLQKYFISFCKINSNESFGNEAVFEDFTIITNTEFDFIDGKRMTASPKRMSKEDIKRNKLWRTYFKEEANLQDDPILRVEKCTFKPRKFKFNDTGKSELYKLFKTNLLSSVLKAREINGLNTIKNKLELTRSIIRENQEDFDRADELIDQIVAESEGKMRKNFVTNCVRDFLKLMEEFLNENGCKQAVSKLKKSLEYLKKPRQSKKQIHQEMMNINSEMAKLKDAKRNKENLEIKLKKFSDSSTKEYYDLEEEKRNLSDSEWELKKMREDIANSEDLDWIKEQMSKDILKRNQRFSQDAIDKVSKQKNLELAKCELDERFQHILSDISMIQVALNDSTFEMHLDTFLEKFRIITNYPNEEQLSGILHDEIGEKFSLLSADLVRDSFEREMINFLKEKIGRFYHGAEGKSFFAKMEQKIDSIMSIGICRSYTEQLAAYDIYFDYKFKDIHKLSQFISDDNQRVLHLSCDYTRLCAIKVFRNLTDAGLFAQDHSYIFIRLSTVLSRMKTREFILSAFKSGTSSNDQSGGVTDQNKNIFDLCVIECREECRKNIGDMALLEQNYNTLFRELLNILVENSKKKIVFIARNDDKLCEKFQIHYDDQNQSLSNDSGISLDENLQQFEKKEVLIQFKDLDKRSQNNVLAKKCVQFQEKTEEGERISLNQIMDTRFACKVIDPENLLRLIENELIQIGDDKAFHSIGYVSDFYIPRKFKSEQNESSISEENLAKMGQKVTLLSNDAGMGKSTVLTSVAKEIRRNIGNAWIVRIDLNDKQYFLNQIKFREHEINECINFVSKIIIKTIRGQIDNPNIRLQRAIFGESLQKTKQNFKKPQIVLILDGFDEISPHHNKKTTTLINALKASDASQLWITTRPHEKDHLKTELDSNVYYLQQLEREEQITYLDKFFKWNIRCDKPSVNILGSSDRTYSQMIKYLTEMKQANLNDALTEDISNILHEFPKTNGNIEELKNRIELLSFTEYIEESLLSLWSEGVFAKSGNFHGTPLNLRMLSVVVSKEKKLIKELDPFDLYQKFVDIQFAIFYKNKTKSRTTNQGAIETNEDHKNLVLNREHNTLAVKVLFPNDYENKSVPDLTVLDELKEAIKEGSEIGEKISRVGLLALRSEQLEFIHHSFAEFFFSKYLKKYSSHERVQQILIENILTESAYGVIRHFFNAQLEGSYEKIKLTVASKNFIAQNLQNNSEQNIRTILKNENHSNIIKFLNIV